MSPLVLLLLPVTRAIAGALTSLWALVALGASVAVLEDAVPVLAGFAARQENLPVVGATIACALGGWVTALVAVPARALGGDARDPRAGRGRRRRSSGSPASSRAGRGASALASRFILGARTLLPLACGAARVPAPIYVIGTAISSLVWAVALVALGWASGETVLLVLGRARRARDGTSAPCWWSSCCVVVLVLQRRNRPHVVEELESADEIFPPKAP